MNSLTQRTASALMLLTPAMPGFATGVVLDDYASDANFLAGKYTFYETADWYGDTTSISSVTVSNGTLKVDNVDDTGRAYWTGLTTAQMWNAGQTLRNPGDAVSIEMTGIGRPRTGGFFIDGDLDGPEWRAAIRWSGYANNLVVTELRSFQNDPDNVKYTVWPAHYEPVTYWPEVQMVMQVRLMGFQGDEMQLRVSVSSDAFTTVSVDFQTPGTQAYFGPLAWANGDDSHPDDARVQHDNLTFTPYVSTQGELNGDSQLTNADISAFVQALTDPLQHAADYVWLSAHEVGDFNSDGLLTNGDIAGFVSALTGGGGSSQVPEPTSLGLLGLGMLAAARRRRG